jgi:hypothetical protein
MNLKSGFASRCFAVLTTMLLTLVSISAVFTTNDISVKDGRSADIDEIDQTSELTSEETKHYHDRNQTSFNTFFEIGTSANSIREIVYGDLDNDGDDDIVIANAAELILWQNPGSPFSTSWQSTSLIIPMSVPYSVDLGDLDNDGDLDIAIGDDSGGTNIAENPQNPGGLNPWTDTWTIRNVGWAGQPVPTRSVKFADFDNDGDLDITCGHMTPDGITIYDNPKNPGGDPWLGGWSGGTVGNGISILQLEVADLDLDGWTDIVSLTTFTSQDLLIWKNDGTPFTGTWSGGNGR